MTFEEVKELSVKLTDDQKLGLLCELLDQGVVDQDSSIDTLREYVDDSMQYVDKVKGRLVEPPEESEAEDAPE